MNNDGFRVGDYWLEWADDDTVRVSNTRLGRSAILHGGDFESILSGMVEMANLSVREALT